VILNSHHLLHKGLATLVRARSAPDALDMSMASHQSKRNILIRQDFYSLRRGGAGRSVSVDVVDDVLKGYALGTEHAITAKAALTLYTINNARIMGVEKERGSVEPGKLADLAVLSQDILSVPADALRETKALMTVVGGKVVYRNGI